MHGQDGVSLAVAQAEEVEFLRSSSTTLQGVGTRRKAPSPVQRGDSLMGPLLPWSQTGYMEQSILAWKVQWTEELGRLQFMESLKVGHN